MAGGWHTEPGCIQHNVPGSEGVYKSYEKCADFFTFGHGSRLGTEFSGTNTSYYILTAVGFLVMIAFLVAWVRLEDRKLRAQSSHLLVEGQAGQVELPGSSRQPGLGGPG
ncbi:MAG: hypothetical protein WAQ33_06160 [Gaiellaceae bacterium]